VLFSFIQKWYNCQCVTSSIVTKSEGLYEIIDLNDLGWVSNYRKRLISLTMQVGIYFIILSCLANDCGTHGLICLWFRKTLGRLWDYINNSRHGYIIAIIIIDLLYCYRHIIIILSHYCLQQQQLARVWLHNPPVADTCPKGPSIPKAASQTTFVT